MNSWITEYVQGLSPAEYQLHILILSILLGFLLYRSHQIYQRFRYISDTATSRIASAAQGFTELKGLGELIPGPEINSPFSQRKCLWYQCIVERRKQINKHSTWVEESNTISDNLFNIQDESGSCIVIPDGAHVIPTLTQVWYGSHNTGKHRYIKTRFNFQRYIGIGRYRFTEKMIMVADPLYIIGSFKSLRKTINNETLKSQAEELVKTWKMNPQRYLTEFDLDKNGKIQQGEWKIIRQHAEHEVLKRHQPSVHHTIQKPEESNHPFVISSIPEQEIIRKNKIIISINLLIFFFLFYVLLIAMNIQH